MLVAVDSGDGNAVVEIVVPCSAATGATQLMALTASPTSPSTMSVRFELMLRLLVESGFDCILSKRDGLSGAVCEKRKRKKCLNFIPKVEMVYFIALNIQL